MPEIWMCVHFATPVCEFLYKPYPFKRRGLLIYHGSWLVVPRWGTVEQDGAGGGRASIARKHKGKAQFSPQVRKVVADLPSDNMTSDIQLARTRKDNITVPYLAHYISYAKLFRHHPCCAVKDGDVHHEYSRLVCKKKRNSWL